MKKICSKCKIEKDVKHFFKSKTSSDGIYCYCKECYKILKSKYYLKNKKYIDKQNKEYTILHSSKLRIKRN